MGTEEFTAADGQPALDLNHRQTFQVPERHYLLPATRSRDCSPRTGATR
jgi:hypothetical protein